MTFFIPSLDVTRGRSGKKLIAINIEMGLDPGRDPTGDLGLPKKHFQVSGWGGVDPG
jgi:hypothetical protein